MIMYCKICGGKEENIFQAKILDKYNVDYYYCSNCGFLHTEEPHWMEEAYKSPIDPRDTGMLARNIAFSRKTAVLLYFLFDRHGRYVDYAGGYGIFTRLMRDIGFNFFWYDLYAQNLIARGFEYNQEIKDIELITSFESFEHFADPVHEMEKMLNLSRSIFFSTLILPTPPPGPEDWDYYGLSHGKHISFYSVKALEIIAGKFGLTLYTNGTDTHLFTTKRLNDKFFRLLLKSSYAGLFWLVKGTMKSKTLDDSKALDGK